MSLGAARIGWLAPVLLLLACVPAMAQDTLDKLLGQPIASVELQVEGKADSSAPLLALIDIKPGEPFTIETYRRVADRFNQVPRFETVRVLYDERPTGLVLIFDLEPRHPITQLAFPGANNGLGEAELQRLIRERFAGLPAFTRIAEVENAVRVILAQEGFRAADVTADISRFHDPDRATLNIHIQAGDRTTIKSVTIAGTSPWSEADILKRLGIGVGQPYRERALLAGLADLRDDLRRDGYYTSVADYEPRIDGAQVDLVLTVNAGPLVNLVVNGPLPGSRSAFIPIERQGSVDEDLLFDARRDIEQEWKRRGYKNAQVRYESTESNGERTITFTIDRGLRFKVVRVELPPGLHITQADVSGIPALKTGAWFSEEAVSKALWALAAVYQQDGYWQIKLDPKYQEVAGPSNDAGGVVIVPNIAEGPRAVITKIVFELGEKPSISEADLRNVMKSKELSPNAPYSLGNLYYDRQAVRSYYERQGFLDNRVSIDAEPNAAGTEVTLRVKALEGPRVVVGEITVVGNERYSRESILREITLRPGEPYSEEARLESRRRLYNLQGFRTVNVEAQPRLPGEAETRIVISLVESGSMTFGFGPGIEVESRARKVDVDRFEDRLEVSPRASVDIGRRNLGGRNRSVNFFGRVSLKPRTSDDPELDGRGYGFNEYRVNATFQERYAFRTNADILFGVTSEQAIRSTYSFTRRGANADLVRPLPNAMSLSARYSFEVTSRFDEQLTEDELSDVDRIFPQVRLSYLSAVLLRDRRDNQVAPSRGSLFTGGFDFGPRWLGSEVGFIKTRVEGSYYRPLGDSRRVILATRAIAGLGYGFEREVTQEDGTVTIVKDLPKSQRFFAGGSNTVRGFQLDRLGVREILTDSGLSDGGNAMLVLNGELRIASGRPFGRALTTVGFLDAGNVFDRVSEFNLSRIRGALGFGFRYDSPFGPLRLDVGFKLNRFTFPNATERRWEFHLSLFEVF